MSYQFVIDVKNLLDAYNFWALCAQSERGAI